jgi:predicted Fe-S protein YdhL (DUF1289 family)
MLMTCTATHRVGSRLALVFPLSHLWRKNQALPMAIESPCILVCSVDMKTGYCFGCGRTRDEIAGWLDMTPETRREIMRLLPARLETVERRPRRETRRTRMARERGDVV